MNKKTMLMLCLLSGITHAVSIKEKIKEIRKALAVHAKSEIDSWSTLEELDKRLAALESRLSAQKIFPFQTDAKPIQITDIKPIQPIPIQLTSPKPTQVVSVAPIQPINTPQRQEKAPYKRLAKRKKERPILYKKQAKYKKERSQRRHKRHSDISNIKETPPQEQQSYFQEKAAYLLSLLSRIRSYVENLEFKMPYQITQDPIKSRKRKSACARNRILHSTQSKKIGFF